MPATKRIVPRIRSAAYTWPDRGIAGEDLLVTEDIAAAILTPIGGGSGIDGRADEGDAGETFRELRFQRKGIFRAELRESMGEPPSDVETMSWPAIAEAATAYLIDTSKDLEAMAMVLEAAVRLDRLDGAERAFVTLADLIEEYWDSGLYPLEDEDEGVAARFQPLSGLSGGGSDKDGTLVMPLRRMVLAGDANSGELRYFDRFMADTQYATAQAAKTEEKRVPLQLEAEQAFQDIEAVARRQSARSLKQAIAHLAAMEAAWRRGTGYIAERTKPQFPATSRVTDELRGMREWLEGLVKFTADEALPEGTGDAQDGGAPIMPTTEGTIAAGGAIVTGRIAARGDALKAVLAAADYFERFEPLSPIGPALRDIDRRARMSFANLLAELIPDEDTRETFYWRSGIKPPVEATEDEEE